MRGGEVEYRVPARAGARGGVRDADRGATAALGHAAGGRRGWSAAGEPDAMALAEHFERGGAPARAAAAYPARGASRRLARQRSRRRDRAGRARARRARRRPRWGGRSGWSRPRRTCGGAISRSPSSGGPTRRGASRPARPRGSRPSRRSSRPRASWAASTAWSGGWARRCVVTARKARRRARSTCLLQRAPRRWRFAGRPAIVDGRLIADVERALRRRGADRRRHEGRGGRGARTRRARSAR